MEQISVTKITTDGKGKTWSRNMTLPKDIWEKIVGGEIKDPRVEWKLRSETPIPVKEVELPKVSTLEATSKNPVTPAVSEEPEEVNVTDEQPQEEPKKRRRKNG